MKVHSEYADGILYLRLIGELDHHTAGETMEEIALAAERYLPRSCALDLSELTFMDSAGVALILRLYRRMRQTGGNVLLIHPRTQPGRVLSAAGIDRIMPVKTRERKSVP